MSYGARTWAKPKSRARRAGKSKPRRTKTVKRSKRVSVRPVKKKRTRKATVTKRSSRRTVTRSKKKKATKKKKAPTFGYDPETGDKVYLADVDALTAETLLPKKPHTVSRYDPSTNRKVKVPVTSTMATDWPTRKPAKTAAGLLKQAAGLGGTAGSVYLAETATRKVGRKVTATAQRAISKGLGAGLGVISSAAGVSSSTAAAGIIAAALVGWNLGKAINYAVGNLDMRLDQALRNYVHARQEAAAKLGRPLTKAELQKMYAAYKETVVRIKSQDPQTFLRPGAGG